MASWPKGNWRRPLLPAVAVVLMVGTLLSGGACREDQPSAAELDALGVVVTLPPLAEFVEAVGGEHVVTTIMVPPGTSPHTYSPSHSQLKRVSTADVYVKVGSGVQFETAHLGELIEQNRGMLIIDCSQGIRLLGGTHEHEEGEEDHEDQGDDQEGTDPHIWNSPANAKKMVENICEGLLQADPDHAEDYRSNRDAYLEKLTELDAYIHSRLDDGENKQFLVYHPSFGYFAEEYGLEQLALEHGGKTPTPALLGECIEFAQEYSLSYVFVEPQFATEHAETVAEQIHGEIAFIDPLARNDLANMRDVADTLALEIE